MGGDIANPTYHQVSAGNTGHAEVVQVYFDKDLVDFETILEWFWKAHDPTTMNRQGADVGTQYRSVIFYETEEQRERAERSKAAYQQTLKSEIVTEIAPAKVFYRAEGYHQDYYRKNKYEPYCRHVIQPKLEKLHIEL